MGIIDSMLKLGWLEDIAFEALVGHTITDVQVINGDEGDEIRFTLAPHTDIPDGLRLKMFHYQDCCESVSIEDVVGEWNDIIGTPITLAEEVTDTTSPKSETSSDGSWTWTDESSTWTFYKLGTVNGYVTIRWYGTSNGYYSESVSIARLPDAA